ncbi:hypothetical protein [Phyllobacterium sp. YR531]|uniref:hypothetical protein n=1 Tax=Phyllobacterium sp. YR531 TaxID=1144343 RepID=UPI000595190F|nr:hypothetical protein [Phyllobacterium sp. YR531]
MSRKSRPREGATGIKGMLPAQSIYKYEVENGIQSRGLCVGRRDWGENSGDFFITCVFSEPVGSFEAKIAGVAR